MLSRFPVRRAAHSRRGVALLLFVMLVFAFFAIAGVAIDMGFANLTQQEMQVATDTAAVDGLRLRNADDRIDTSDTHRREKASHIVRLEFDDDMKPSGNAWAIADPEDNPADYDDLDHLNMGAGPGMQMPGQLGNQHIATSSDSSIWDDPVLRYNLHNKRYGDMVSGTYRADAEHVELGDTYERPDFEPGVDGNESLFQSLGFLVRMRRVSGISVDGGQNPYDTEPDVSYRGRPVPFLFSLGSMMQGDGTAMDPRLAGITVRSTAIAVARPALRASAPPTMPDGTPIMDEATIPGFEHPMIGLFPFALTLDYWISRVSPFPTENDPTGTWHKYQKMQIEPDGTLIALQDDNTPVLDVNGQPLVAGRFAEHGKSAGQQVVSALPSHFDPQGSGYVAVYTDIPSDTGSVARVVGYGFCTASEHADNPPPLPAVAMQMKTGIEGWGTGGNMDEVKVWIGPNGVSARLDADAPQLTATEWAAVFERNHFLAYGPWMNAQGDMVGGEITYDYNMIRHGSVLAATLAR